VILYILLCGYPPFIGRSDTEIIDSVKSGAYTFKDADWGHISPNAIDLVRKMMCYDFNERITA
jgi:calcium-dependent protein kinase